MHSGMPKPVCSSHDRDVLAADAEAARAEDVEHRLERDLDRHHHDRDDEQEEELLEREVHEGERVGGEGREHDRDDRGRDRDDDAVDEARRRSRSLSQTPR